MNDNPPAISGHPPIAITQSIKDARKIRYPDDRTFDDVADRVMERHADLMRKLAQ